jgi:glucokinase
MSAYGSAGAARIVADFGGTNARFATLRSGGGLDRVEVLACADYPRAEDAIAEYRDRHGLDAVSEMCLAVAGPTDQDLIDPPNSHWTFSRGALGTALGAPLTVINDFTAQALSLDLLEEDELTWFGDPRPRGRGTRTVVGPGTGLGVAVQMPGGEIMPSEGGHVGFAPTDAHEIELLRLLFRRHRRVSVERLASGPGLENLYWANRRLTEGDAEPDEPWKNAREVGELAAAGDPTAKRSVEDFFDILAGFAGDMALATWATGGVYLSGGVLRKLMPLFDPKRFRARFEAKGRFSRFCEQVPLAWISFEHPGLLGCSAVLEGLASREPRGAPHGD